MLLVSTGYGEWTLPHLPQQRVTLGMSSPSSNGELPKEGSVKDGTEVEF